MQLLEKVLEVEVLSLGTVSLEGPKVWGSMRTQYKMSYERCEELLGYGKQ